MIIAGKKSQNLPVFSWENRKIQPVVRKHCKILLLKGSKQINSKYFLKLGARVSVLEYSAPFLKNSHLWLFFLKVNKYYIILRSCWYCNGTICRPKRKKKMYDLFYWKPVKNIEIQKSLKVHQNKFLYKLMLQSNYSVENRGCIILIWIKIFVCS